MQIFSLVFSLQLSLVPLLLTFGFICSALLYSPKKSRLKDNLVGHGMIDVVSLLTFLIGYYATSDLYAFEIGDLVLAAPKLTSYTISKQQRLSACPSLQSVIQPLFFPKDTKQDSLRCNNSLSVFSALNLSSKTTRELCTL